ncbi:PREDICTED: clotting factor B-like [Ceratosolen solmsi marchali]|uniref:Clotting factor B-like n=1 Tax=Ceratosolen solmsi marchali TaxID=326594 RepID=A0AAJ7DZM7_9HYME|nr:PREDICTED: clotting factor B-like [Ceratosolen solmsi marchali]
MYLLLYVTLISIINALPSHSYPPFLVDIVGGSITRIEDYPFQVAVILEDRLWCGGTIISNEHVLTAAHCVFFATSTLYVRAGSSYWSKDGSLHRVIYNTTYGPRPNEDLSVIKVSPPFHFDETRQPIPLFYRDEVISPGTMGTVIGWGMTSETFISDHLRVVDLPYVDKKTCKELYSGTIIGRIMDGEICAGYIEGKNKDACQGDSGGPFIIDGRQAGIIAMGRGCGQPNSPGIFTDIAYYNEWIMEQISLFYTFSDNPSVNPNIIGGVRVPIQHFPYTVSILDQKGLWCSGSIITVFHVLTGSYCVYFAKTSSLIVHAGTSYWRRGGSYHHVIHNSTINPNIDIAILIVKEPFEFDETRRPIGMFSKYDMINRGMLGILTSWSNTRINLKSENSDQLRAVSVPIVEYSVCNDIYTKLGGQPIRSDQLCAGTPDKGTDPCQGDSGAPLVINNRLVGIVSTSYGCGQEDAPGVYTIVSYYSKWIYEQIST